MARTSDPDSATAQFFINVANNDFLNYNPGNPGYAVFGRVTKGTEVVDAMLVTVILPFNLLKAGINSVITFLVYKPISRFVFGERHGVQSE